MNLIIQEKIFNRIPAVASIIASFAIVAIGLSEEHLPNDMQQRRLEEERGR